MKRRDSKPAKRRFGLRLLLILATGVIVVVVCVFTVGRTFVLLSAKNAVANRDHQAARRWISIAKAIDSRCAEAEFLLARICRREGRVDEMQKHLRTASDLGLDRKRANREWYLVKAANGELQGIEDELRNWLADAQGDDREVCQSLVNGLAKSGRRGEALVLIDAWEKDYPEDPEPNFRRGLMADHLRRKQEAEAEYRAALAKAPDYHFAAYALARVLWERKELEESLFHYRQCTRLPNPIAGEVGVACCLNALGQPDEARQILQRVVELDEQTVNDAFAEVAYTLDRDIAATELGKIEIESGNYAEAEKWLRKAVESFPLDQVARYSLAVALRGIGRTQEAQEQFARVRVSREALEEAGKLHDRIVAHPDDVDSRFKLGKILLENDSVRKGLFWLNGVLVSDPDHEPTKRFLAEFRASHPQQFAQHTARATEPPPALASIARSAFPRPAPSSGSTRLPRDTFARPPQAPAAPLAFTDVTPESELHWVYRNGREAGENAILESLGGGVAILDFDRDGQLDLCFPGGGLLGPNRVIQGCPTGLWRGRGQMRFEEVGSLAGISASRYYTHGVAVGDYDNDGFADILITGYGGLQLFHNRGDGTFRETALSAGLRDASWSSSAAWGDLNGDGNLDLYIVHYVDWSWKKHPTCASSTPGVSDVCSPKEFEGLSDTVYFSNGDGTFRDATSEAGLVAGGKGLGVITADIDQDGDLDVYVANDTTPNFLYVNQGQGVLSETGLISGTAMDENGLPNGSMGICLFDFDLDLREDLWVCNYQNETFGLYQNLGSANFASISVAAGIHALERLYVAFGAASADLDLDGDGDIVVANGHVMYHPKDSTGPQPALALVNNGRGRLEKAAFPPASYFSQGHWGRGVLASDLDYDGDIDLVFSNSNEPSAILRNETKSAGKLLTLRLIGTACNRDAIGAFVILHTSARDQIRTLCGGGSYLSSGDHLLYWGVPEGATVQGLTVHWPDGQVQKVDTVTGPGIHTVAQASK